MRISCPYCGERDAQEFAYLGDATKRRPDGLGASTEALVDYAYLRDNPAEPHRELWYHGAGCHAWLVAKRNTLDHAIETVEVAREVFRHAARDAP